MTSNNIKTVSWKQWAIGICAALVISATGFSLAYVSEHATVSILDMDPTIALGPKSNHGG